MLRNIIKGFSTLSHISADGTAPKMVDISHKSISLRRAKAMAIITIPQEAVQEISKLTTGEDIFTKKGPVLCVATVAGTNAVKKTSDTIPFCHHVSVSMIDFDYVRDNNKITVLCEVKTEGKTGVEMEALHGVTVASLTIYDMLKSISHYITITDVKLMQKEGGKSIVSRD